jgi:predicted O-methyltransferase YrrM
MEALDMPNPRPWNLRPKYYGFAAPLLHGASLRACGLVNQADTTERNHFIRHGAKISLIHATRGRCVKAAKERWKWLEKAKNPSAIEHIFGLDLDDEQAPVLAIHRHVFCRGNGGPVEAWNTAAAQSRGEVLVQMSDDWEPPLHWDQIILDAIGDTSKPAVLAISDGHRKDDLLCMAIMTRARYNQQGFMFHPEFFSMYSDDWFSRCAFRDGVVIDARDRIVFEHIHPAFGKAELDETYARSNNSAHYARGKAALDRLQAGIKTAGDCQGWCDYRDLYQAIAAELPDGSVFAEVGSWMGQSIIVLAQELQNLGKKATLICVDTFKGEQNQAAHVAAVANAGGSIRHIFEANVKAAQVDDMIRVIEGDSAESAALFSGKLDGVFIDADHSYNGCKRDVEAWFPKVKTDGIFCGHDYPWHEVKRAVDEHAAANGYQVGAIGRCWIKQPAKS